MPLQDLDGPISPNQYKNLTPYDKGGMGEVYTALDSSNGEKVAVKIVYISSDEFLDLLSRELEVCKEMKGKYIAETLFTGEGMFGTQKFLYLVQRFYSSGNMRKLIRSGISFSECIAVMNSLIEGLDIAHKKVVHRDLKPENVLVDNDGNLLLTDFGLAKYVEDATKSKTFKGSGTYPYMSPECWTGQTNSVAMDIYSLGIMFFEILTGQLPAKCNGANDWRDFHLFENLPEINTYRNDIPVKLKQILLKMTQKRVQDRYKSVGEIKVALSEAEAQANEVQGEIERLAQIAHSSIAQTTAEQLRKKEKAEKEASFQKLLNYHITELYDRIKQIVAQINEKLSDDSLKVVEKPFSGNIKDRTLQVSFGSKSIYVSFSGYQRLHEHEKDLHESARNFQKRQYGMVVQGPSPSIFRQKNIVLLGELRCNYQNPFLNACFGMNLLLVKPETEQYGKWFRAIFSDTGFGRVRDRKEFSLREEEFLKEFELCFAMHTMSVDYCEIKDSDLTRAVQEILSSY